jgi:murein DD-endopeptidase MepM/ murein hydrolase activator NlpD
LCFKEIKLFKLSAVIVSFLILTSLITMVCAYLGIDPLGVANLRASSVMRENEVLKAHLASLDVRLGKFQSLMDALVKSDDQLRTSVNLSSIPADMRKVAIGGAEVNSDYGISGGTNKLIAQAMSALDVLNRKAKMEEQSYVAILQELKKNQDLFARIPAIDPIRDGVEADGFGMRIHPILHVRLMHEGLDIVANAGTSVHATGDGVVSYVGREGGYGNVVEIDHGFGYTTLYGHLLKPLVPVGQKVKRGQVIALSGNTGLSTGPHLHYEVRKNGVHVDPSEYFFSAYDSYALYRDQPRR